MSKIIQCTLGDIGKVCMCKRVLKEQTSPNEKIPFYKISTFGGKADTFISESLFKEYKSKYSYPKKGDILISAAGTLGKTVIYDGSDSFYQDSNIVWIGNDETKVLNAYLYYFYRIISWKKTTGSTIDRLYNENISGAVIFYPESLLEQQKIITVLKALDNKVELNNKVNAELESIAKTLYDYWFLQFEFPNEEGKPYKSSGGKMVYNEQLKREIPEGWEVKELGTQIIENEKSNIQVNKVENYGNIPFFTSGEDILNCSESLVSGLNIYMSTGGNANIKIYFGEASYSTDTWCFNCSKNTIYIYEYIMTIKQQINDNYFNGSGLKHLKKEAFKNILLCVPDNRVIEKFNYLILSFFKIISKYKYENQELSSLRDFLLPLLMNGQVTFKDENEELENEVKKCVSINNFEGFNQWKQIQGYAARGEADDEILKKIYDAMDDDDKK